MARILIVEDEGILAFKTQMDLERLGHEVIGIADDANKAIEMTHDQKPDLILMDIVLHGSINGIEAAGIIGEKYECNIVFMTAHTDKATVESAQATGHMGFLHKPFNPFQLKRVIEEALSGKLA